MKVAFYIIGKNGLCIIYDTTWNQGHIQGKMKQWNISERSIFLKTIKILLLACSIKVVNLRKTVLIISVHIFIFNIRLLFVTKEKISPQQNFYFPPLGGIPPTPKRYLENPAFGNIWTELCLTFIKFLNYWPQTIQS